MKLKLNLLLAGLMCVGTLTSELFVSSPTYAQCIIETCLVGDNIPNEGNPIDKEFDVTVASDIGVYLRNHAYSDSKSEVVVRKGDRLHVVQWAYGQPIKALGLGTNDARWYKVNYKNKLYWIPAGWVFDNFTEVPPMP